MKNKLSREEVLKKAIEKAVGNGWLKAKRRTVDRVDVCEGDEDDGIQISIYYTKLYRGYWNENYYFGSIEALIFSKEFCIAFWGEGLLWVCSCGYVGTSKKTKEGWPDNTHSCGDFEASHAQDIVSWNYHRHQMLDSDDYIEYLRGFV